MIPGCADLSHGESPRGPAGAAAEFDLVARGPRRPAGWEAVPAAVWKSPITPAVLTCVGEGGRPLH